MDRSDTWLNAQRGKRRELLIWLWLAPLAAMIAAMTWTSFEPAGPFVIIAVLVVFALLRVGAGLLMRAPASRKGPDGKPTLPMLTWCRFALMYLICANLTVNALFWPAPSPGWEHWHQVHDTVELVCAVCYLALVIAEIRYLRRLRENSGGGVVRASG